MEPAPSLVDRVVCPHCWHRFAPQDVVCVARHSNLIGDPVAGPDAYLRFAASRFTVDGVGIDPEGVESREVACPRCHLEMARAMLQVPPMFVSVVGAPASGKSYFLSAMTWQLRSLLPKLGWSFLDADPGANSRLHVNEQRLFLAASPDTPALIEKTPTEGADLYRSVLIDGRSVSLPRPFQFVIVPNKSRRQLRRALVLYDNAGEHFLPGRETGGTPMTEHLARSQVLMFLLDPTQDPRMRPLCQQDDPQLHMGPRGAGFSADSIRQETILNEVGVRIRRSLGLSQGAKHKSPLIVVLAKADLWHNVLGNVLDREPLRSRGGGSPGLDITTIKTVSERCRAALDRVAPEFVAAADALSKSVFYVPVSALGRSPEIVQTTDGQLLGIRPRDVRPKWVSVPMLIALQSMDPDHFPVAPVAGAAAASNNGERTPTQGEVKA